MKENLKRITEKSQEKRMNEGNLKEEPKMKSARKERMKRIWKE